MNMLHIAWRELRAILQSAMGWLVLAGFLLLTGFFWHRMLLFYVEQSTNMVFNPYGAANMNLSDHFLVPYFENTQIVLVMICPALSMRLFSEEYKQRTMELLLSSPISTAEIVLGKWLGATGFYAFMLLCTAHYPASLYYWGNPEPGVLMGGYLGMLVMGAALIAMGLFFSAMTNNQVVALVLPFTTGLVLFVLWWWDDNPESIAYKMAISTHLQDLVRGQLRMSDLVYYAGFTSVFLFAAHQRIESLRWR